jgi:hypothetical protein
MRKLEISRTTTQQKDIHRIILESIS